MTLMDTVLSCDGTFGCDCVDQRRMMTKNKRRKIIPHGTRQGYQRHLREKTPACNPCLAAHAEYHRGRGKNGAA